jgi:hypothetical protein
MVPLPHQHDIQSYVRQCKIVRSTRLPVLGLATSARSAGTAVDAASTLLLIASGVLALKAVGGLTRQQEERARGLAVQPLERWSSTGAEP